MKRRYTVSIPVRGYYDFVIKAEDAEQAKEIAIDKWIDISLGLTEKDYDYLDVDQDDDEEIVVERMFL